MATEIFMPQLGLTMTEGTITKWFKAVGEKVSAGEVLVEIATDKISNQMEAPVEGVVLQLVVNEGETAPVKAMIALIGAPGEIVEVAGPKADSAVTTEVGKASAVATNTSPARETSADGRIFASPLARRLAREMDIDLALVTGTGPNGRIVERDIMAFKDTAAAVKASPLAAKVAAEHGVHLTDIKKDSRIMKDDVMAVVAKPAAAVTGIAISGMRKVIAERMSLSWSIAPHVNMTLAVDMTAAGELKAKMAQMFGIKLSFTEFIVKCSAQALAEFKAVNSSLIDGKIVEYESVHVGVAVALDNGLIVPVVRDAQTKSIRAIRQEVVELSDKARKGALLPDEITGGTFTISNLGMYGIDQFTPIINQPESAILGVCRIVDTPVVINGEISIKPMMNLCLSFDHRLIDGAFGAKFLARIKELLEQPLLLL